MANAAQKVVVMGLFAWLAYKFGWENQSTPTSDTDGASTLPVFTEVTTPTFNHEETPNPTRRYLVRDLSTSNMMIGKIKGFEGFRSEPYTDSAGVWTIGYGTTKGVTSRSAPVTKSEAHTFMIRDMQNFHVDLVRMVDVRLKQGEYDALMSFLYNFGANKTRNSTLMRLLNEGNYAAAANEFSRWVWAKNKKTGKMEQLAGLITRRAKERAIFIA